MRCPDHNRELVNGACPLCGGMFLSDGNALEAMAAGASSRLKPEERPDSLAYKKVRLCPEDAVPMAPLRIDRLEAWVEKCPTCEGLWVEKSDVRTLTMLHKSKQRQQGYASLSDAEKKELAQGLAESTARETGPDLNLAGATLVAVGVPLLNKVEGGRTPWATFGFAIALTAAFAFLDAGNLGYVAGSADLWRLFHLDVRALRLRAPARQPRLSVGVRRCGRTEGAAVAVSARRVAAGPAHHRRRGESGCVTR